MSKLRPERVAAGTGIFTAAAVFITAGAIALTVLLLAQNRTAAIAAVVFRSNCSSFSAAILCITCHKATLLSKVSWKVCLPDSLYAYGRNLTLAAGGRESCINRQARFAAECQIPKGAFLLGIFRPYLLNSTSIIDNRAAERQETASVRKAGKEMKKNGTSNLSGCFAGFKFVCELLFVSRHCPLFSF